METIINLPSLVVALVSLGVGFIALRRSKEVLKYSSRQHLPDIEWNINDSDVLSLNNKSAKLFSIIKAGFIKINYCGYEDMERKSTVRVPLVTASRMRGDFENKSKIIISKETAFACAYLCPYKSESLNFIKGRIHGYQNDDGTKRTLPSLQSVTYIVEVTYTNKFLETKSLYWMKKHYHGSGYHHTVISEEAFFDILKIAELPEFTDNEKLWDYVSDKYSSHWSEKN